MHLNKNKYTFRCGINICLLSTVGKIDLVRSPHSLFNLELGLSNRKSVIYVLERTDVKMSDFNDKSGETSTAFGNPNSTRKRNATIFNYGYFNMFAPKCSPISSPMNISRQTCFGSLLYYNNNQQNQVIFCACAWLVEYDML